MMTEGWKMLLQSYICRTRDWSINKPKIGTIVAGVWKKMTIVTCVALNGMQKAALVQCFFMLKGK
jgi:hypothetical protein